MFWGGIIGSEFLGPFRVPDGVKMTSAKYVEFLKEHFLPWYRSKGRAFKSKFIFMHDNAPSHAAANTTASLQTMGIKREKIMIWPPSSPDLNPIENLWGIMKRQIYQDGRQFTSKGMLWEAIVAAANSVDEQTIQDLTNSMNNRLVEVISKHGGYIGM